MEDLQGFFPGAVPVGAVGARLGESASARLDLVRRLSADVGVSVADQLFGALVHLIEIVGSKEEVIPLEAQPLHVLFDVAYEFLIFGDGVRVVVTQIEDAAVLERCAGIQTDGLAVSDVQVSVGLWRESGTNLSVVLLIFDVFIDDVVDEVTGHGSAEIGTVSLLDKILSHCFLLNS